jgi:type II secretory pathway component PulC
MDNKEYNIETETVVIIKNKKTGQVYKDEEELKAANVDAQDISKDVVVKVTNKGLEVFKKFMSEK